MTTSHPALEARSSRAERLLLLVVLPVCAVGLALFGLRSPTLAVAAVAGLLALVATVRRADTATLVVIFVLYTNAAAVAVQFHGVPFIVGAASSLLLVIPLCYHLVVRAEPIVLTPVFPLIALFAGIQMLGALRAVQPDEALRNVLSSLTEGVVLYFLVTNVVRTPGMVRHAVWTLLAAGALMAAVPLYQMVTSTYGNTYGGFAQVSNNEFEVGARAVLGGRLQYEQSGSIGQQNYFAQMLLMLFPLGLVGCARERTFSLRLLAGGAAALTLVGIALTYSRGAALGVAMVLLALAVLGGIRLKHLAVLAVGAALFLAVFPQYGSRLLRIQGLWNVLSSQTTDEPLQADASLKSRTTEVRSAAQVFFEHPLLGVGPGMFKYHYQEHAAFAGPKAHAANRGSHNLYLGLAAEHGLLGLMCFLAIVCLVMRQLLRRRREWRHSHPELAWIATAFVLSLIGYLTAALGLHFAFVRYFWLMLALASVVAWLPEAPRKEVAAET